MTPTTLVPSLLFVLAALSPLGSPQETMTPEPTITPISLSSSGAAAASDHQAELFTGTFRYGVPITVPAARGGSEPAVALQYSSVAENSWCGVGWNLEVGCIERNGERGVPILRTTSSYATAYDDAQGYVAAFGGASGRLVSGTLPNVFRPEIDTTFVKYVRDTVNNKWVAYDLSGNTFYFGCVDGTTDAVLQNPKSGWGTGSNTSWSATFRWGLKKIVDSTGNVTYFDYLFDEDASSPSPFRQQYLHQIRYNGHVSGAPPTYSVVFNLERTPGGQILTRPDPFSTLRPGFKVLTRARLKDIKVHSMASLVRRYALAYTPSDSTGRSMLHEVTQFGTDDITALPPVTFGYSDIGMSFGPKEAWTGILNENHPNDIYWNTIRGYGRDGACGGEGLTHRDLRDVDMDGRPDLIFIPCSPPYDHFNVQYNTGSGFAPTARSIPIYSPNTAQKRWVSARDDDTSTSGTEVRGMFQRIDFDGDRYEDTLWRVAGATGGLFHARLSNRGIEYPSPSNANLNLSFQYDNQGLSSNLVNCPEATGIPSNTTAWGVSSFLDLNGDGRPDYVQRKYSASDYRLWNVQLNTGVGLESPRTWTLGSQGSTAREWNSITYSLSEEPEADSVAHCWETTSSYIPNTSSYTTVATVQAIQHGQITHLSIHCTVAFNGNTVNLRLVSPAGTIWDASPVAQTDVFNGESLNGTWAVQARDLSSNNLTLAELSTTLLTIDYAQNDRGSTATLVQCLDINGDGLLDRVEAERTPSSFPTGTNQFDAFAVELNNGSGFDPVEYWPIESQGATERRWTSPTAEAQRDIDDDSGEYYAWTGLTTLRDINGDGLPDRVQRRRTAPYDRLIVQLNMGSGFLPEQEFLGLQNPDGTSDADFWGAPSGRAGYQAQHMTHELIDMDGDGLLDRVMEQKTRISSTGSYDRLYVQRNLGERPDLLRRVSNGLGGIVAISYVATSELDNREVLGLPDPHAYGVSGAMNLLPDVRSVVSSVTISDGIGSPFLSTLYSYAGGFFDTLKREFRGFHRVVQVNPDQTREVTYFHQGGGIDEPLLGEFDDTSPARSGRPYRTELYGRDAAGVERLFRTTVSRVDVEPLGNGRYFPKVSQSVSTDYEGLPGPGRSTATRTTFESLDDSFGDAIRRVYSVDNLGEVSGFSSIDHSISNPTLGEDESTVVSSYAVIPASPHILDRVSNLYVRRWPSGFNLRWTKYTYNSSGQRLTEEKAITPGGVLWSVTSFGYDVFGNVEFLTDPVGVTTRYERADGPYHQFVTTTIRDWGVSNATTTAVYDYVAGLPYETTSLTGVITRTTRDSMLRTTETSYSDNGSTFIWTMRTGYLLGGIVGGRSFNRIMTTTNNAVGTGRVVLEYQDGLGREIQTRSQHEDYLSQFRVTDTVYDARGNVSKKSRFYLSPGTANTAPDTAQPYVETQYDALNRGHRILPLPPGSLPGDAGAPMYPSRTDFADAGSLWVTVSTVAEGSSAQRVHKSRRDGLGRVREITDSSGQATQYEYTLTGELTSVTSSMGHSVTLVYDAIGRKTGMTDPNMGTWQYEYDEAGRLTRQTDAMQQHVDSVYDRLGRISQQSAYDASGKLKESLYYEYDTGDPMHSVYQGQLYRVTDAQGWEKFGYDRRGNVVRRTRFIGPPISRQFELNYTYDTANRMTSLTYPNGLASIGFTYDVAGNLRRIESLTGTGTAEVFYEAGSFDTQGALSGYLSANGSIGTSLTRYPLSQRLQKMTTHSLLSGLIQDISYSYDPNGNPTEIIDGVYPTGAASASVKNVAYDALDRLTRYDRQSPTGTQTIAFSYDDIGNMLSNDDCGKAPYEYGSSLPHAVTQIGSATYSYDVNGNMVYRNGHSLSYDTHNRLVEYQKLPKVYSFGYDYSGTRLWKSVSGLVSPPPPQLWVAGVYEEKGGIPLCHVVAGSRHICTFEPGGTGLFQYTVEDSLKSTGVVADRAGTLIQRFTYRAFGQTNYSRMIQGQMPTEMFAGQDFDNETGLYYFKSRYYDPTIGRFIQPDTVLPDVKDQQSWNKYSYALNGPLRFNDPTGHIAEESLPWPAALGLFAFQQTIRYMALDTFYQQNVKQERVYLPIDDNRAFAYTRTIEPEAYIGGTRLDWAKLGIHDRNVRLIPDSTYSPTGDVYTSGINPYVYHRQWGRVAGPMTFANGRVTELGGYFINGGTFLVGTAGYAGVEFLKKRTGLDKVEDLFGAGKAILWDIPHAAQYLYEGDQARTNESLSEGVDGLLSVPEFGTDYIRWLDHDAFNTSFGPIDSLPRMTGAVSGLSDLMDARDFFNNLIGRMHPHSPPGPWSDIYR